VTDGRVAVVGLGYWGPKLLRNLVTMLGPTQVVAVEAREERRREHSAGFPGVQFEESYAAVLDDPTVASVVVATPVETHGLLARQALEAGKHVLVEKPVAGSSQEALGLATLADTKGLVLMVGHTFLFSPRVEAIRALIDSGEMGRLQYVTSSRLNLGIHRPDANVIWDLAPHDFSIVFHLLGEFPVSLHCMAQGVVRPELPDVAFINMTFPSGAMASVSVSWLAPRKVRNTTLVGERSMVIYDDTQADEPVKIYDKGVIVPDSASFGENQLTYRTGSTVAPNIAATEPLMLELRHFLDCTERAGPVRSDGWFGLEVVRALEASDRSWRAGGVPVDIETVAPTPAPA
jgi:predicted dehydrogenase